MSTENLQSQEAVTKIKEMAESIDFAMLCTDLGSKPFHAIPMSTKRVDKNGAIWFLSGRDSNHNDHIKADSSVELIYSHPSSMQFLNVYGNATIHTDKQTLESLYGKADDAWFSGVDDPNLSAIKVQTMQAHYWDPKVNKLVAMAKLGLGAITGETPDISNTGKLKP